MARTFAILLSARGVLIPFDRQFEHGGIFDRAHTVLDARDAGNLLAAVGLGGFFALLDFDLVAAIFSFSLWDILVQIAAI
jgi:hypothetical protein